MLKKDSGELKKNEKKKFGENFPHLNLTMLIYFKVILTDFNLTSSK